MAVDEVITTDTGIRIWLNGNRWGYVIDLLEVVDAATLKVRVKGEIKDLPIWYIDAPGIKYEIGQEAKKWVEEYIKNHSYLDPRFYKIKEGQMGDSLHNLPYMYELVEKGYAWLRPEIATTIPEIGTSTPERILLEYQNKARSYMLGIWRTNDPAPPWERYK